MSVTRRLVLAAAACVLAGGAAFAQTFPSKPIRLLVPYPPGSNPDVLARLVGEAAAARLKQPVVIENRPGAGGTLGTDVVAKAQADGYTLLVGDSGPLAIAPWIYPKVPYVSTKDFVGVASLVSVPMVLVVSRSSSAKSAPELITQAKGSRNELTYGSLGVGSIHHLGMEVLASATGMKLLHVPYKGNGELATAVINGEVQLAFSGIPSVEAFIRDGRLRALAVSTSRRSEALRDVQTFQEHGVKDYDVAPTIGIVAPAGVPPDRLKVLEQAFLQGVNDPKVAERLKGLGMLPRAASSWAYTATIASELHRYAGIVKAARIQPE